MQGCRNRRNIWSLVLFVLVSILTQGLQEGAGGGASQGEEDEIETLPQGSSGDDTGGLW